MNRDFTNIKSIPMEHLETSFHFCFTYNIQPNQKVEYTTNKGTRSKRKYHTLPFKAQKSFLLKNIGMLDNPYYYFEQCSDNRFHIHGYIFTTAKALLLFMKKCFEDNNLQSKSDLHDRLLLVEKVEYMPNWVAYCQKYQKGQDVFIGQIEEFLNNKLDEGIEPKKESCVKIETREHILLSHTKRNFDNYLFGEKKFLVEI